MKRWQQIESIFHQTLERDPAQRDAWLIEACASLNLIRMACIVGS